MEKALKFEKSYVRMLGTIRKGDYEKALADKISQNEAQQSGFALERKNAGADMQTAGKAFWRCPAAEWSERILTMSGCSAVGSAPALGAGCRRFESCHSDQKRGGTVRASSFFICGEKQNLRHPVGIPERFRRRRERVGPSAARPCRRAARLGRRFESCHSDHNMTLSEE